MSNEIVYILNSVIYLLGGELVLGSLGIYSHNLILLYLGYGVYHDIFINKLIIVIRS